MTIYVDAEVDLDDHFPEVVKLITAGVKNGHLHNEKLLLLKEALKEPGEPDLKIENLVHKMKFEYMCKVFDKYSLKQLETLLPE
jgi:hypothetical protein